MAFPREIGVAAHLSSHILSNLRRLLLQRNLELLPATLDGLEAALKKVILSTIKYVKYL